MPELHTYVALLYSVVLAKGQRLIMSDFRNLAEQIGLIEPRTVLATGNLIFVAQETDPTKLEAHLEEVFEKKFGRHIDILVRTASAWKKLLDNNPYPEISKHDAAHVVVRVMRHPMSQETFSTLSKYLANGEQMVMVDEGLWIHFARISGIQSWQQRSQRSVRALAL